MNINEHPPQAKESEKVGATHIEKWQAFTSLILKKLNKAGVRKPPYNSVHYYTQNL